MKRLPFLALACKRLRSRTSLTLLLILSAALTIGIMVCVPVFSGAVSLRLMQEELAQRTKQHKRPAFSVRIYAMPSPERPMTIQEAAERRNWLAQLLSRSLHLPLKHVYMQVESRIYYLRPAAGDARYDQDHLDKVRVLCVQDIEAHIQVTAGAPLGQAAAEQLPVWVERHYADQLALQIGDVYTLGYVDPKAAEPITMQIVGFWEARDAEDFFWYKDPVYHFDKAFLTTFEQFEAHLYPRTPERTSFNYWYYVLDESRMNLDRGEYYISALSAVARQVEEQLPSGRMDDAPLEELARGQQRKLSLALVLIGFAVPLFGILIYFMASISAMAARFQRREVAMLSSRGAGRSQILALILVETLIILIAALPLGVLIGGALARLMGYSLSFLRFASREPLPVYLAATDWRLVGLGLLLSTLARLWPTWRASQVSVVTEERRMARTVETPGQLRLLLMVIMVALTYYAYRQLALKGGLGLVSWRIDDPSNDPLLLLAPTLFLFTAPLVAAELFVFLMRPFTWLGKLLPSATAYLGCLNLGREVGQYRTPIYILVLCLTMGIFYASLAYSANTWLVDRRRYEVGADLTFRQGISDLTLSESGGDSSAASGSQEMASASTLYNEEASAVLPLSEYRKIPGVADVTWVGEFAAKVPIENLGTLRVLAIDRLAFARIAYFRGDFARHSLGEMMNRLGAKPNGIIIPQAIADQYGLSVGNTFPLNLLVTKDVIHRLDFEIVDTFTYFPTVYDDQLTVIVNSSYLEEQTGGIFPNGVWMRLEPQADGQEILDQVGRLQVDPNRARDLRAIIRQDQQRLERVGLFGLLSICFLAGALLSGLGLLVYNLAAMVARGYRFAVLRAMGMRQNEVLRTVSVEYLVTLVYGVLAGAASGVIASTLYVPLFPLTDTPAVPVPPFIPFIDWPRALWMAGLMACTLILIEAGVLWRMARTRIFEALRLGVRE